MYFLHDENYDYLLQNQKYHYSLPEQRKYGTNWVFFYKVIIPKRLVTSKFCSYVVFVNLLRFFSHTTYVDQKVRTGTGPLRL